MLSLVMAGTLPKHVVVDGFTLAKFADLINPTWITAILLTCNLATNCPTNSVLVAAR